MGEKPDDKLEGGRVVEGRYRLERLLGEGGMGVVWAAVDETTKEPVALKFLRRERDDDPTNRERFLREANAAMAVNHPNVARVRDVRSVDGVPYLVMDLLEGESLRGLLRRRKVLTVGETARVIVPTIAAVDAAHAQGIVHRDLKPENIFLVGGKDVRVLDFGIAKRLLRGEEKRPVSLTETGAIIGTPSYMAPEQVFADEDLDARADVWALGIILYECLAGKKPTDADGFGQVLRRITTDSLEPLDVAAPGVPRSVAAIVNRMLSRNRNDRPSLPEVRAALERAVAAQDEAVTADIAPPTRREEAHVVVAPSIPPPEPQASPMTTTEGVVSKRPEEVRVAEAPRPKRNWMYLAFGALALVGAWYLGTRSSPSPSANAGSPSASPAPSPSSAPAPSVIVVASAAPSVVETTPSATSAAAPRPTGSITPPPLPTTSAQGDYAAIMAAFSKRDGPGCLKALDAYDQTQSQDQRSTSPAGGYAAQRAMCMMLAGDCAGGKALYRRYLANNNTTSQSDAVLDGSVDNLVGDHCEGQNLAPHDELVRADHRLSYAANAQRKATAAECLAWHASVRKLAPTVTVRPTFDPAQDADARLRIHTPLCLIRAGDCSGAARVHREEWIRTRPKAADLDAGIYELNIRSDFEALAERGGACKKAP